MRIVLAVFLALVCSQTCMAGLEVTSSTSSATVDTSAAAGVVNFTIGLSPSGGNELGVTQVTMGLTVDSGATFTSAANVAPFDVTSLTTAIGSFANPAWIGGSEDITSATSFANLTLTIPQGTTGTFNVVLDGGTSGFQQSGPPSTAFTNTGGGLTLLTVNAVPEPSAALFGLLVSLVGIAGTWKRSR